jgi:LemA protein
MSHAFAAPLPRASARSARHARFSLRALFLALAALVVAGLFGACSNYDVLVDKDQACQEKWSNVEAALQRRYDLVDNLVATVKGQAAFEKSTLENIATARAEAGSMKMTSDTLTDPQAMKRFEDAQAQLKGSMTRLLAVAESYPELKTNQGFHDLRVAIEGSENRLLRAREEYNGAVRDFNAELGRVRGKVVNKVTGQPFKPREYFKAEAAAAAAPRVSF